MQCCSQLAPKCACRAQINSPKSYMSLPACLMVHSQHGRFKSASMALHLRQLATPVQALGTLMAVRILELMDSALMSDYHSISHVLNAM